MAACLICHTPAEADDIAIQTHGGTTCICLWCFGRETGTELYMPKKLRRIIEAELIALTTWGIG